VALAIEAGAPRNALTQRHLETRLREQVVGLKELREKDKAELAQLRADVEGLVRAVNQLTQEQMTDGRCGTSRDESRKAVSRMAIPVLLRRGGGNGWATWS
jgi:cell division protein FtsB